MKKNDLIEELELIHNYLSQDIQELSYIRDDLESENVDIPRLINSLNVLIKSMFYNNDNIERITFDY